MTSFKVFKKRCMWWRHSEELSATSEEMTLQTQQTLESSKNI